MDFFWNKRYPTDLHKEANIVSSNDQPEEKGLLFTGCLISDIGLLREKNEDNFLFDICVNNRADSHVQLQMASNKNAKKWHIFCVFDGMGGGEKGEAASGAAAKVFLKAYLRLTNEHTNEEIDEILRKCFLDANNEIVHLQRKYKVFGTTGTVLCTNGIDYKIYHLGDSRAYLLRSGVMRQLTKDQTLAQMKVDMGIYKEDDPQAKNEKHKLTEYIGKDWTKENLRPIESEWLPLQGDDCFLLCSDGLYDMCEDREIFAILKQSTSEGEATENLVKTAIARGGYDNITCMVLRFQANDQL